MLKAKVIMPDGVVVSTDEGTPQGGPLSPLLSNIVLSELDDELSRRGHKFVRYADDCNIYVKSERAGQRVLGGITEFIEKKMRLKVNRTKSAVARPEERHFLGVKFRWDEETDEVRVTLSKRTLERMAKKSRELTPRNWGNSLEQCIERINRYLRGWFEYFKVCSHAKSTFEGFDGHTRRRLRMILLRQQKRNRSRLRSLCRNGAGKRAAAQMLYGKRRRLWAQSIAPVTHRALSNSYFQRRGLFSLRAAWDVFQRRVVQYDLQFS
jgi:RNA-directed DNA polymerase